MDEAKGEDRARREAADWFTRLSRPAVTTQSLRAFRAWRREPGHRAAYEAVEAVWDRAGGLAEDPQIRELRREVTAGLGRRGRRREGLRWALAAAAVVLLLGAAITGLRLRPGTYATRVGEQRIVRLDDGSTLRLNTDSRVRVRLGSDARRLQLVRGEALFEVAHDARRPFLVRADGAEVRALGTVFGVRRRDGRVDVNLLEGAVRVSAAGGTLDLKPNQRAVASETAPPALVSGDARARTSWTQQRLTFAATPLATAVAEVNRYTPHKVILEPAELAAAPVSGVFETGDSAAFAAAVAAVFDLEPRRRGDGTVVLRRRAPAVDGKKSSPA